MSGIHRHADLQQRGVRANAVITSIHEQGQGEYRRTYYPGPLCNVSVHVTMASGETFDASTQQFVPFTKLASFAPGSAITVRFDPNNHYAVFAEIPPDPVIAIDAGGDAGAGAGAGDKSL